MNHFSQEVPTSQEINCIRALCDLTTSKTRKCLDPSKSTVADKDSYTGVTYSIAENQLVGTKINEFLSTFVKRTKGSFACLVELSIIQKAVELLPFVRGDLGAIITDPACWAYFLAAVRVGSLQSDQFEVGQQQKYYESMALSLQSSNEMGRIEVILAHLLVAFFCFSTEQTTYFEKHCGFAKKLLDSLHFNVPNQVQSCFFIVAHGSKQLLIPPSMLESGLLKIFLSKFSVDPENFRDSFPYFSFFMNSSFESNLNISEAVDEELFPSMLAIFQGSPPIAMLLMTARFLQQVVVTANLPSHEILGAISEISKIFSFVLKAMNYTIDSLAPIIKSYTQQVECFKCLLVKDFMGAKYFLRTVFDSMDFWMLRTGYLTFGEVLVHQLHLLIAAAAILGLDSEYHLFWQKLKLTYSLMQRPLSVPQSLQDVSKCNFYSLCLCKEPTPQCLIPFAAIKKLCSTDELSDEGCTGKKS